MVFVSNEYGTIFDGFELNQERLAELYGNWEQEEELERKAALERLSNFFFFTCIYSFIFVLLSRNRSGPTPAGTLPARNGGGHDATAPSRRCGSRLWPRATVVVVSGASSAGAATANPWPHSVMSGFSTPSGAGLLARLGRRNGARARRHTFRYGGRVEEAPEFPNRGGRGCSEWEG